VIEQRHLFNLESKLRKGTKTIPVKALEKDYVLSWILIGISKSELFDVLCFKGGTALKKFYFPDYRFSEDLDFTLIKRTTIENIERTFQKVFAIVLELSNIRLALKNTEIHANSYTLIMNFSGPLGADLQRGEIKNDITMDEKLIYPPAVKALLREHAEYKDIPDDIKLRVYSLEEIFLEKYLSILDPSRNEPRDVFDLWFLVSNDCLEYNYLGTQLREKGIYKGVKHFDIIDVFDRKEKNYRTLWTARLEKHLIELPQFDRVYREIRKCLKPLNESLID